MKVHCKDRKSWRKWLDENHATVAAVWLVFDKKHTNKPCVTYDEAVEEALCVGWIDSLVKRLDDDRYLRKFTPRTNTSMWSASNLKRMKDLTASGRMTAAGRAKLGPDVRPVAGASAGTTEIPDFMESALAKNEPARVFFQGLAPSYRRSIIAWVSSAKKEETRQRRLAKALSLLEQGKKPSPM